MGVGDGFLVLAAVSPAKCWLSVSHNCFCHAWLDLLADVSNGLRYLYDGEKKTQGIITVIIDERQR